MTDWITTIRDRVQEHLAATGLPFYHSRSLFWYEEVQTARQELDTFLKTPREEVAPLRLAPFIDHTLLKPEATRDQIHQVCQDAVAYHFASVCVNPFWVSEVHEQLKHTSVKVCTVIGFPLGATTTEAKVAEAALAMAQGAEELDMVLNIGALKAGNLKIVYQDIYQVVTTAVPHTVPVKVILETALLTDEEIVTASVIAALAGAAFVKTSTGFSRGGATVAAVELMQKSVAPWGLGVKASGGIRNFQSAWEMIAAGATRIGASASKTIIQVEGS